MYKRILICVRTCDLIFSLSSLRPRDENRKIPGQERDGETIKKKILKASTSLRTIFRFVFAASTQKAVGGIRARDTHRSRVFGSAECDFINEKAIHETRPCHNYTKRTEVFLNTISRTSMYSRIVYVYIICDVYIYIYTSSLYTGLSKLRGGEISSVGEVGVEFSSERTVPDILYKSKEKKENNNKSTEVYWQRLQQLPETS